MLKASPDFDIVTVDSNGTESVQYGNSEKCVMVRIYVFAGSLNDVLVKQIYNNK